MVPDATQAGWTNTHTHPHIIIRHNTYYTFTPFRSNLPEIEIRCVVYPFDEKIRKRSLIMEVSGLLNPLLEPQYFDVRLNTVIQKIRKRYYYRCSFEPTA